MPVKDLSLNSFHTKKNNKHMVKEIKKSTKHTMNGEFYGLWFSAYVMTI